MPDATDALAAVASLCEVNHGHREADGVEAREMRLEVPQLAGLARPVAREIHRSAVAVATYWTCWSTNDGGSVLRISLPVNGLPAAPQEKAGFSPCAVWATSAMTALIWAS